ncbi:MAG: hypothetical protein AAF518_23125 [Spirochaetota bacterium]
MINLKELEDSPAKQKVDLDSVMDDLQERLYLLFKETFRRELATIIVLEGWAGAGKGDLLKSIAKRLDPRKIHVYSFMQDEYKIDNYPFLWKYWKKLPPYGHLTVFDGSWYSGVSYRRKNKFITKKEYHASFRSIINFEKTLLDDNYLIFKFFLNISKKEHSKRLKKAQNAGKTWKSTASDVEQNKNYKKYKKLFEYYLNTTNLTDSPWNVVPSKDEDFCQFYILDSIISNLETVMNIDSNEMLRILKGSEGKTTNEEE